MNEPPDPPQKQTGRSPAANFLPRGPSDPAVAALKMRDLLLWTIERVAKMPRDHKFTVGDRLIEACLQVATDLTEASYLRDKLPQLAAASRGLVRGRLLIDVAQQLRLLSPAQRKYFTDHSLEIGKMIGGWTKAVQARHARQSQQEFPG